MSPFRSIEPTTSGRPHHVGALNEADTFITGSRDPSAARQTIEAEVEESPACWHDSPPLR